MSRPRPWRRRLSAGLVPVVTVVAATTAVQLAAPSAPAGAAAPAGWRVVERAVVPRTHALSVALVEPGGTTRDFGADEARARVQDTADYLRRESDGLLDLRLEQLWDWSRVGDQSIPCSWTGSLHDDTTRRTGWQGGARRHLTLMVPRGEPCPGWANGEQGWSPDAGGRTFQPGPDAATLVHELGHNMSVAHSASLQCTDTWDPALRGPGVPEGCWRAEYGNRLDPMGNAWGLHPLSSPNLDRLAVLPRVHEPVCGRVRTLAMTSVGAGASGRTAVSWVDPTDPAVRYWVDLRSVADGHRYDALNHDASWLHRPTRGGLQVMRTDPALPTGTAVVLRPGDDTAEAQLTRVGEQVGLHGGAWVRLDSLDGDTGRASVLVPCAPGVEPEPDPTPTPAPTPGPAAPPTATSTPVALDVAAPPALAWGTTTGLPVRVGDPAGPVTDGTVTAEVAGHVVGSAPVDPTGRAVPVVDTVRLGVGEHTVVLRHTGSATHAAGTRTVRVTVRPARVEVDLRRRGGARPGVEVAVTAETVPARPRRVVLTLRRAGTVLERRALVPRGGRATWRLPRTAPGPLRLDAVVAATATTTAARDRLRPRPAPR